MKTQPILLVSKVYEIKMKYNYAVYLIQLP